MKKIIPFITLFLILNSPVFAYIDPGTTSAVFTSFSAILMFFLGLFGFFYRFFIRFFKKIFKFWRILLILIIISLIIIGIYKYMKKTDSILPDYKKVFVIGIDGMDPKIVSHMLDEGTLPNIKTIAAKGSFQRLATGNPPASPSVWSSIATGVNPGKHGIFDFIRKKKGEYLPELSILNQDEESFLGSTNYKPVINIPAFWDISAGFKIDTRVIRWPITFPPNKIAAKMFAGLGAPDIKGNLGDYTYYSDENPADSDEDKDKFIKVEIHEGEIKTLIKGPRVKTGFNLDNAVIPLNIKINSHEKKIDILLEGKNYTVSEGGWSDWLEGSFKAGFLKKVSGIFKFHLNSLKPFSLYMSPLEINPRDPVYKITQPETFAEELFSKIGYFHTLGMPEDTKAVNAGRITKEVFLEQCNENTLEKEKILFHELETFKEGVFAFVFDTSDRIQHLFWNENQFDDTGRVIKIAEPIRKHYLEMDRIVGKLANKLDRDSALIILSDHGFSSYNKSFDMNRWLYENGFLVLKEEPAKDEYGFLFSSVDWSRSKLFSLGFNSIYYNLNGREKNGIVFSSETQSLQIELSEKLLNFKDLSTNIPPVHALYPKATIYKGEFLNSAPDFIIGFKPGYRMSWITAIGGVNTEIITENKKLWQSDHLIDPSFVPGVLITNFKTIKTNPSVLDIAPTIIKMAGISGNYDFDGTLLY